MRKLITPLLIAILIINSSFTAPTKTIGPQYYKCWNVVKGIWELTAILLPGVK